MSSPTIKLNDGHSIPTVGLGCWMSKPVEGDNPETYEMVTRALKVGNLVVHLRAQTLWVNSDRSVLVIL
jgi:diketogulonate reductase-like aldo/keto reductase